MARILTSAVLIVVISCGLAITVDARDDDGCQRLSQLDYELFGTKTIYNDALRYIRQSDDDDLPKPFDDDSLEEEHRDLVKDKCVPLIFYFVGRHSARFPDSEDIAKYNSDLLELISKLKQMNNRCQNDRLENIINWRSKMRPKHDNLITELGAQEEQAIAKRFKKIYPEFFDANTADISIGVTKKIRTAQTGAEFLKEVSNLNITECQSGSLPTNDVDRSNYNLDNILDAACYRHMTEKYAKSFLDFHNQCEKINGDIKIKDPRIDRAKGPSVKWRIADRIATKLGLDGRDANIVKLETLDSIYNMCKFENALKDDSVWCKLFDRQDIEVLEYIEDVNSYIKSAYGPKANPKQSCPLVGHLVGAFRNGTSMSSKDRKRSHFYFSHADPMKKLLATFGMFKDDENFSDEAVRNFERNLKVPRDRHWRTSVITPFSANMAFILYKCDKFLRPDEFKILATVTEQPVKLGGCGDTDCSSKKFFNTYEELQQCDLDRVCSRDAYQN